MTITLIHMSDLHFRQNWEETQGVVLSEFFMDLEKQVEMAENSKVYIVFSGDFVLRGAESDLFKGFHLTFDEKLSKLGIPKSQRITVPGNHDIEQNVISEKIVDHEGILSQNLNEREFNDYVSSSKNVFTKKFSNYLTFQSEFSDLGLKINAITGTGWDITENIAIYCLNSAICSSGGVTKNGNPLDDKNRLAIDSRNLQKWLSENTANTRILIMHHPIDWLTGWAQKELKIILKKNFCLLLSGHNHNQTVHHSITKNSSLICCSAPPLLTNKNGDLGYSIIRVSSDDGVQEIKYRQWTKNHIFVSGVNFSDSDDGVVNFGFQKEKNIETGVQKNGNQEFLTKYFDNNFRNALFAFSKIPKIWVDPILNRIAETDVNHYPENSPQIDLHEIILNPKSIIIKAPPQFGLTSLALYMCNEAWVNQKSIWICLDAKEIKANNIERKLQDSVHLIGCELSEINCIVLDSWTNDNKLLNKIIQKCNEILCDIPLIVMETIEETRLLNSVNQNLKHIDFDVYYLWAFSREKLRKLITAYNEEKEIGEIDAVITRIISDLEVLNLPRTPLNCLTLLKALEIDFDESPINRTEMIKRILFILFNSNDIPSYKARPDLKDCEYVLGFFCETMIRKSKFIFTRDEFLEKIRVFCEEKIIDLEVQVVFDVLYQNAIIVNRGNQFCFRFTYWISYFVAQRMHQDEIFANFIFEDMRYANIPEIIEFYTGIDRRREDALKILINDISYTCNLVNEMCGFQRDANFYDQVEWKPSSEGIEKLEKELASDVQDSNLPDSIKDEFADRSYDQTRPYRQDVERILNSYSLEYLQKTTRAGARALRNSDYANPELKRELLQVILKSYEQLSSFILALAPILARDGLVTFQGTLFALVGDFGESIELRFHNIISVIPANIFAWYKDDLHSSKMGPLLFDQLSKETSEYKKSNLIQLIINQKPRNWKNVVQRYIRAIDKNSFYLSEVYFALVIQYKYSFTSFRTLEDIKYLLKMCHAKHNYGVKKPGKKVVANISDDTLPKRQIDI